MLIIFIMKKLLNEVTDTMYDNNKNIGFLLSKPVSVPGRSCVLIPQPYGSSTSSTPPASTVRLQIADTP
jgi:hypothetical protein